jgi:hypothetical protein
MRLLSESRSVHSGFAALQRVTIALRRSLFLSAVMIVVVGSVTGTLQAASVGYKFTYTEGAGPLISTTFQIDEPDFLTPGIYSIPSFSMTDGASTWTFTQLLIDRIAPAFTDTCVLFGTSASTPFLNLDCGAGIGTPLSGVFLLIFSNTTLSAPGSYLANNTFFNGKDQFGNSVGSIPGSVTLDILTPEPSTAGLLLTGMLILGVVLRRRRAHIEQPARWPS